MDSIDLQGMRSKQQIYNDESFSKDSNPEPSNNEVKMIPIPILDGLESIPHSTRTSVYTPFLNLHIVLDIQTGIHNIEADYMLIKAGRRHKKHRNIFLYKIYLFAPITLDECYA